MDGGSRSGKVQRLSRSFAGTASFLTDRIDGIHHIGQRLAVVAVGSGQGESKEVSLPDPRRCDAWCPACLHLSDSIRSYRPLFGGHRRRVHRGTRPVDLVGQVQAIEHVPVDAVPQSRILPSSQPPPACHPGAPRHLERQAPPWNCYVQDKQD